uniref:Uncharacterized protein n=1 Tax=Moschus moschiferus TaxID=68415 RepID=A0A8C6FG36_MOSMO
YRIFVNQGTKCLPFSGVLNVWLVENCSFRKAGEMFLTLPSEADLRSEFCNSWQSPGSTFLSDPLWAAELASLLLFFRGVLKLNPNKDPVAELLPNANGFDFSLLKMLLTDSEPNTNFGGETTAFVVASGVPDTPPTSEVVSAASSPP